MIARTALILLLSLPVVAQGTDFAVELNAPAVEASLRVTYTVTVLWHGDEPARDVVVEVDVPGEIEGVQEWSDEMSCTKMPVRCTIGAVRSHASGFNIAVRFPAAGTYTATARITSSTPDPRPENNVATRQTRVTGLPSLGAGVSSAITGEAGIDPGTSATTRISVSNSGETVSSVIMYATLPEGGRFVGAEYVRGDQYAACMVSPQEVVCHLEKLQKGHFAEVRVDYITPERENGGTFAIVHSVSSSGGEHDPSNDTAVERLTLRRLFAVTHTGDEGAGSLRQAMLDSRVFCEASPCTIRIPATLEPILPLTPLPRLRGLLKFEGGVLDGTLLAQGDGLYFEGGCEFRVQGVAIRNFNGHAIETRRDQPLPACGAYFISPAPVVITKNELTRNLRGIVTAGISADITDNKIRDHRRVGIFAGSGYYTHIRRNEITGNGASGIFIGPPHEQAGPLPPGADIFENVIRNNGEWGIGRAGGGAVQMMRNSISGNVLLGIDVGLDLETPAENKPVLTSAMYDPLRGETVVRGRVRTQAFGGPVALDFYASSNLSGWGLPEAERWIRQVHHSGDFEVVLPGDLRGQWITATATRVVTVLFLQHERQSAGERPASDALAPIPQARFGAYDTSELSNAVQVH